MTSRKATANYVSKHYGNQKRDQYTNKRGDLHDQWGTGKTSQGSYDLLLNILTLFILYSSERVVETLTPKAE
uniref:Uncharacterized protein n=1 Tax=Wuchereria bancrofti TaxID=6293 RepID=A0AAF5PHT9_WUCBA